MKTAILIFLSLSTLAYADVVITESARVTVDGKDIGTVPDAFKNGVVTPSQMQAALLKHLAAKAAEVDATKKTLAEEHAAKMAELEQAKQVAAETATAEEQKRLAVHTAKIAKLEEAKALEAPTVAALENETARPDADADMVAALAKIKKQVEAAATEKAEAMKAAQVAELEKQIEKIKGGSVDAVGASAIDAVRR